MGIALLVARSVKLALLQLPTVPPRARIAPLVSGRVRTVPVVIKHMLAIT